MLLACAGHLGASTIAMAQSRGTTSSPPRASAAAESGTHAAGSAASPVQEYLIGPTDVLLINFWHEKELTSEVVVRPDGKISLPLLNEIHAAGLTPEQLRANIEQVALRLMQKPIVTVVVKQVNNNRVFITGQVLHPGPITLAGPTTVVQAIAMAGGLTEFADRKNILITRIERGQQRMFRFNYADVLKGRNVEQNIVLKPGDTILVP